MKRKSIRKDWICYYLGFKCKTHSHFNIYSPLSAEASDIFCEGNKTYAGVCCISHPEGAGHHLCDVGVVSGHFAA